MTEREAREILNKLLVALQKFRSIAAEEFEPELLTKIAGASMHWYVADDGLMAALIKALDKSPLEPLDFFNIMIISTRLSDFADLYHVLSDGDTLPEADPTVVQGWEPATEEESVSEAWKVGWQTVNGFRNITTVYAASEAEAVAEGERVLRRPGRTGHWRIWNDKGRQVRQKEIL